MKICVDLVVGSRRRRRLTSGARYFLIRAKMRSIILILKMFI